MPFGPLQAGKSYHQLWQRSQTRTPQAGRGSASLVLGSDRVDHTVQLQVGDRIEVATTGDVNDSLAVQLRGLIRLNALPPTGYGWQFTFTVDGYEHMMQFVASEFEERSVPIEYLLNDIAISTPGLGSGVTISFALEFIVDPNDPGSVSDTIEVVLPSVYVDELRVPESVPSALYLANRSPAPFDVDVSPDLAQVIVHFVDTDGAGLDLASTVVTIGDEVVFNGGFVSPWTGSMLTGQGPAGDTWICTINVPSAVRPFDSEQLVTVRVQTQLLGGLSAIDETWAFTIADTIRPVVQSAVMHGKRVVRVRFTDEVQQDDGVAGALNPANYTVTRVSKPSASLQVVAVTEAPGEPDSVDVHFDTEASFGAEYALVARNIADENGNAITADGGTVRFTGFVPPQPAGRRFELLDFFPEFNVAEDREVQTEYGVAPGPGDLRRLVAVLQDLINILLSACDDWIEIIDIDRAPEQFLDAILQDLGNPFTCITDLSVLDKRRLARVLISIYKQKGTRPGVINAIRFFLGIEVTLDIINHRTFWQLGISYLDVDTTLAPPTGSPLWYSFYIVSPVTLTQVQRDRMLCIANYMRCAHEHVLGVTTPGSVDTPPSYWTLDVSLLGSETTLS